MSIIAWLRTPAATLIVLCAALASQVPHAADVFRLIVAGEGWPAILHGYAYAIALELAVLLFVVQKRDLESYMFAGVSILVNLSYYSLHGIHLFTIAALPAWLVSIALPSAIARYSHLLVDEPHGDTKKEDTAPEKTKKRTAVIVSTPTARPSVTLGHPDATPTAAPEPAATPKQPEPDADAHDGKRKLTQAEKDEIVQMRGNGIMPAEIASTLNLNIHTVRSTITRASKPVVATNGTGVH